MLKEKLLSYDDVQESDLEFHKQMYECVVDALNSYSFFENNWGYCAGDGDYYYHRTKLINLEIEDRYDEKSVTTYTDNGCISLTVTSAFCQTTIWGPGYHCDLDYEQTNLTPQKYMSHGSLKEVFLLFAKDFKQVTDIDLIPYL